MRTGLIMTMSALFLSACGRGDKPAAVRQCHAVIE